MLTHFSLFTGIGGADLAAEWAGFKPIGQCEWADYPTKILEKHWPKVPRWRDIRDVCADNVRDAIGETKITVLSGGFPCQPFSVAGKRKGKDDDRFLWPEMLRVISELKPTWVIGENVAGFVNMALEDACIDLENQGYEVQAFLIPACSVGAWHKRERVFIIAHNDSTGLQKTRSEFTTTRIEQCRELDSILQNTGCELFKGGKQLGAVSDETQRRDANIAERPSEVVSNGNGKGLEGLWGQSKFVSQRETGHSISNSGETNLLGDIWESEPNVGRVANGIPSRVDRLKCLGNAIVPQQIYPIFKAIAEIEKSMEVDNGR